MPNYIIRCTKTWEMVIKAPSGEAANLAVTTDEMCDQPSSSFDWDTVKTSSGVTPAKTVTARDYWILDAGGVPASLTMENRILAETSTDDLPPEGHARRRGEWVTDPDSDYWLWLLSKVNGRAGDRWIADVKRGVA
jgi:hypothetical protein